MSDIEAAKQAKAIVKEQEEAEEKKKRKAEAPAKETKPASKAEKKEEKKEEKFEEKFYTFPLKEAWKAPRCDRAMAAAKVLKKLLKKHVKRDVKLDKSLNEILWKRGIKKPPSKVKVRVRITKDKATAFPVAEAKKK